MFQDELLPGFDFLAPNELYDWSQQVFEGTDCNLFPNILITISIPRTGEQAGFLLTKENENFGVFFPDIPPEEWEEDTEFEKFEDWLENLMKEKLEEILKDFWITNFKNIYHLANLTKITPCRLKTLS